MKRMTILTIGAFLAVIFFASAAFVAFRLLNAKPAEDVAAINGRDVGRINPGSGKKDGVSITFDPAPELPSHAADLVGKVTDIQDHSLFVVGIAKLDQGTLPSQEVLVTKDTRLYRDATTDNQPPPSQSEHLQQVVAAITLSKVAPQNIVEVWGQTRGSRLIADVIVVHPR